jgi:hypothetical protein
MRLSVEIMLRGNNHVFTETILHPPPAEVTLRGMNWIVHPAADGGVVIALEIHSASAVAGPVPMAAATLEGLIDKAIAAANRPGVVH